MERSPADPATFVDAHFHFDLFRQPAPLLSEIERLAVRTLAVTNAPSVFHHTLTISRSSRWLLPAVGLHPELVAERGHELAAMWPMLEQTRYVGEIGLDYVTNDSENRRRQKSVFSQIVARAAAYGDKVLSVHSRRSSADILSIIGERFPGMVILHWFSGTRRELERAVECGCYFSVGPAMVRSKTGLALVASIPRDRILTETDGPFVQVEANPAKPSDIPQVVKAIADIWEAEFSETKSVISRNMDTVQGLLSLPVG